MSGRIIRFVLLIAGLVVAVLGAVLMSQVEDVFGDEYRQWGSLGLALVATGSVVVVLSEVALAWPEAAAAGGHTVGARFDTPGRLLLVAAGLAVAATVLIALTADAGGAVMYHPHIFLGIGLGLVAVALAFRGLVAFLRGRNRSTS